MQNLKQTTIVILRLGDGQTNINGMFANNVACLSLVPDVNPDGVKVFIEFRHKTAIEKLIARLQKLETLFPDA